MSEEDIHSELATAEGRIKTLEDIIATLGGGLNAMREDRDRVRAELEQAQAELRRRGSILDVGG